MYMRIKARRALINVADVSRRGVWLPLLQQFAASIGDFSDTTGEGGN
jgi:hypothetical protein